MLINSLKCYSKCIGSAFDYNLYSFGGTRRRWYASGKKSGKDDPQSFEWRCECPRDTMPMNSDPYRIKVPEIAVPPLPVSKAKRMVVLTQTGPRDPGMQDWAQQQPNQKPQFQQQPSQPQAQEVDDSFLTKLKKFFRGKNQDQITNELNINC